MSSPGFLRARTQEANWDDLEVGVLRKRPFLNLYDVGRGEEERDEYRLYPLTMLPLAFCPFQTPHPPKGTRIFLGLPVLMRTW